MNNVAAVLQQKRRELLDDLARIKEESHEAGESQARDYTDTATEDQSFGEMLEEATLETETLKQVEDALQRVADGSYGKCVVCGKPIDPARLAAIPWTPYCREHEQKLARQ
jgi:DnaK suppressor protein